MIRGPAEEILAAVRHIKAGERAVYLSVEVPARYYYNRDHYIPEIKGGQTHEALRKTEMMSKQTVIDDETDQRLVNLIREAGEFTR
jgi:hypothetical protein